MRNQIAIDILLNMREDLGDVSETGYAVIRDVFSTVEIDSFVKDFETEKVAYPTKAYTLFVVPEKALARIKPKLMIFASKLAAITPIRSDMIGIQLYVSTDVLDFPWHQDHGPWFLYGDLATTVHLWAPLINKNPDKNGICVVNYDKLKTRYPDAYKQIVGRGGISFEVTTDKTVVKDDETDQVFSWPFSLEEFSHTPRLVPGDLLIMRGDMIHRTQDVNQYRLALTVRMVDSKRKVSRSHFFGGGQNKVDYLKREWRTFLPVAKCFEQNRMREFNCADILAAAAHGNSKNGLNLQYNDETGPLELINIFVRERKTLANFS